MELCFEKNHRELNNVQYWKCDYGPKSDKPLLMCMNIRSTSVCVRVCLHMYNLLFSRCHCPGHAHLNMDATWNQRVEWLSCNNPDIIKNKKATWQLLLIKVGLPQSQRLHLCSWFICARRNQPQEHIQSREAQMNTFECFNLCLLLPANTHGQFSI